ncbi:peptide ABC transporter substrate-binding protein [Candidatus Marinamargulisbacteria bacterium SCGC AG-414-C22]|nr:peptide ABC transporter substrate-binding protein [Candidatus Marinamargulisbacteria bacterium SCGC AG-414-C22]
MKHIKKYLLVLCCALCVIIFMSCDAKDKNLGNILHKGNGAEPQTLDPHKAEGVPSSHILRDLYESLTEVGLDGNPVLGAAESYELSQDGTVYRFYLRKNAVWSNGDPVTAHDFEYGLKRSVDPATGSKYSLILAAILNAEDVINGTKPVSELGVRSIDDYTLEIELKAPTPYFFDLLNHSTTYPVHKKSVETHGTNFTKPANMVTNGAYTLKEWVIQSHIELERNPRYWNNANTAIDGVIYYAIEETSSSLKKYRAGELDWTESLPSTQFDLINKKLKDELHVHPYLGCYYYGFNVTKPPFKDNPNLRVALSLAIDRQIITEQVSRFFEMPAYSFVPPGVNNYDQQPLSYSKLDRAAQIALAKEYYQKAGYSAENPAQVEIRYNTLEGHKKIAVAISAMWKQLLGVETTIVNEEWKVFLETRKQKQKTQVFRAGWIGDYNDANTFLELLHSKHGINDSGYNNPAYDDLLRQASFEVDQTKRKQILEQAERLMLADHPIIPIYFYVSKRVVNPRVKGFKPNIVDRYYTKNLSIQN